MREASAKDIIEFVRETNNFDLLSEIVLYRGQSRSGNLVPSIARRDAKADTAALEKKILSQLTLMGAALLPSTNLTPLELLVIAQHYGLQTRLLDWTSNPLAALYFACAKEVSGDTFVYALEADRVLVEDVYSKDPFEITKTRVFQPRLSNPRIVAQHGWFTLHRYSRRAGSFVSLEKNPDTKDLLTEIRIPKEQREEILRALDRHGVNRRSLFPDLEGLCLHLNWKFELDSRTPLA
jgi:FRG domain